MKVRVLVGTWDDGRYVAYGWLKCEDEESYVKSCIEDDCSEPPEAWQWIEAEVPAPETPTVKGEVVE